VADLDRVTFRDQPVDRFLELIASRQAAPGGGAVAAMAAAMAAGLVAMAARFSDRHLSDAGVLAREADRLRDTAARLADEDAIAYGEVRAAYAQPAQPNPNARRGRIHRALTRATDVPLEVARVASEVAAMASRLVEGGNPNLRGDAMTAVWLARAAVRACATLVECNVRLGKLEGDWLDRSAGYLAATSCPPDDAGPHAGSSDRDDG
jgi:formiminotetrahydrofolate cyclodeaminase